ncbi:MAG TPA: Fic family protein [Candidatus Acidoferrum sp.]|nr:Fic family protein [Candidatus Acidoferrum sp.]
MAEAGSNSHWTRVLPVVEAVPGVPVDDVEEVSNYVAAMPQGLRRIKEVSRSRFDSFERFTEFCFEGVAGQTKHLANLAARRIGLAVGRPGNAAFVPPPSERMMECLDRFEHFLHDEKHKLLVLAEAGLIHVQFETMHPFLDGNGWLGRLPITSSIVDLNGSQLSRSDKWIQ